MCQCGANRNPWAGYLMGPSTTPTYPQTEGLQIGDYRLSTSRGVVERPDHRRGDDHVLTCSAMSFAVPLLQLLQLSI